MAVSKLTSKGRITIPAAMRKASRLRAGDQLRFVEISPGCFEMIAENQPIAALKGMFGPAKRRVSIVRMNAAIAARGRSTK